MICLTWGERENLSPAGSRHIGPTYLTTLPPPFPFPNERVPKNSTCFVLVELILKCLGRCRWGSAQVMGVGKLAARHLLGCQ